MNGASRLLLLAGVVAFGRSPARSLDRPTIRVAFHLKETKFAANFFPTPAAGETTSELARFEAESARRLAVLLQTQFGFLDFTTGSAPITLDVDLVSEKPERQSTQVRKTHFRCVMKGSPELERSEPLAMTFRSEGEYGDSFSRSGAVREIAWRFEKRLSEQRNEWMQRYLQQIPICDHAYFCAKPKPYTVLPFTYSELFATEATQFLIEAPGDLEPRRHVTHGVRPAASPSQLPKPFNVGIRIVDASPLPNGTNSLTEFGANDKDLQDVRIFVLDYARDYSSPLGAAPSDVSFQP